MNKFALLIPMFLCCLISYGQNSKTTIELELTPTIVSIKATLGNAYDPRLSFTTGFTLERLINNHFSLKTGLNYERKGAKQYALIDDEFGSLLGTREIKINQDYLTMPILISSYTEGKAKFYLNAGPFLGLMLSNKTIFGAIGGHPKETINDTNIRKIDLGFIFGAGVNITINENIILDIGLRNNMGLFNTSKIDLAINGIQYSNKTNSFGLQLGIKFNCFGA
jgi:opacity protein-like surface antigen